MARLPKTGAGSKREKLGTTVLESTLDGLRELQARRPDARSIGEAIDLVCGLLLDVDPRVAEELRDHCRNMADAYDGQIASLGTAARNGYAFAEKARAMRSYADLADYLNDFCPADDDRLVGMRRVDLKGGDYLVCPESWPILNEGDAPHCSQVVVIEVAGGDDYGAPHFVYLKSKPGSITGPEKDEALELAQKIWPDMGRVLLDEVPLVYDSEGNPLNEREHLEAPIVCYFMMPEASECSRKEDAPYGAMIFRA